MHAFWRARVLSPHPPACVSAHIWIHTAYLKGIQHADRSSNIRPLQHKHTHTPPGCEHCQQLCYLLFPRSSALCLRAVCCLRLQSLRPLQPLHPLHLQCKDAER